MGLLDAVVAKSFRDEKAGRVVVFSGDRRNRGYLVRSKPEELKIRSFLKMFYFAQISILLLGMQVANAWSRELSYALWSRPAAHLHTAMGISLGIYSVVVLLPYFLLWRFYKKALLSFVSSQDEVLVSGKSARRQPWVVIAGLTLALLAVMGAVVYLIRAK